MEFGQDELKDQYSDNKEEDQDQEEEEDDHNQVRNTFTTTTNNTSTRLDPLSFCAPSISSSSSSSSKKWPQIIINNSGTGNNSHLQLMDYLSLKTGSVGAAVESSNANSGLENRGGSGGGGGGGFSLMYSGGEREHMFDKVVTPSDVGKLNRLVIPKQHAEKYFPLDSASNEKGLLLNFEDRSGKSWRFRYSYWNSSQSYVITKGWSRFVKEKKLDAGDIVSFERESPAGGGRLFIDWRRRPHHQYHPHHHHHHQQYHHLLSNPSSLFPIDPFHQQRWGGGGGDGGGMLHSLPLSMSVPMQPPQPPPPPPRRSIENLQYIYNSSMIQYPSYNHHHHHHQQHQFQYHHQDYINPAPAAGPAVAAAAAAAGPSKRLRLFGVNMEYCPMNEQEAQASSGGHERIASASVQYPLQVRIPTHDNSSPILPLPLPLPRPTSFPAEFSHEYKGKSANNSLSFDLDP